MARRNNSCIIAINHNNDWGPHPMRPGRPGQRGTRRSVGNRNSAPPRQERSPPFATGIEWARPRPAVGGAATKKNSAARLPAPPGASATHWGWSRFPPGTYPSAIRVPIHCNDCREGPLCIAINEGGAPYLLQPLKGGSFSVLIMAPIYCNRAGHAFHQELTPVQ